MAISEGDLAFIEQNLGRPARGAQEVVARCPVGHPLVVRVKSVVDNKPFPTLYWLVCKEVSKQIDKIEASGCIKNIEDQIDAGAEFGLRADHLSYAKKRQSFLTNEDITVLRKLSALEEFSKKGVGGVANHNRIKCLHIHFAYSQASNEPSNLLKNTSVLSDVYLCNNRML